ncbi:transcriptional regulator [Staphylococcus condimenti]|uniref:helix-turn-helix domain-containing protein n=1 Tax=Staphylococcus TaxID=1279 RepID=UPI0006AB9C39|nr:MULTISPECIES: helix-turn-helix transcriptional regulator [Staphylococcus]APR61456.1 transcriptional regulator [Staphylococcus condimenti]MDK8645257.1 helix-turn-helix transcriptional regulator [Staphylococcus condimenti]
MIITMRAARVNTGMTQAQAAKELGINTDTLVRYEKNNSKIPRNIISEIEDLYQVDSDNIFFGVESEFFRKFEKGGN